MMKGIIRMVALSTLAVSAMGLFQSCNHIAEQDRVVVTKNTYGATTVYFYDELSKYELHGNRHSIDSMINEKSVCKIAKGAKGWVMADAGDSYQIMFNNEKSEWYFVAKKVVEKENNN